VFDPAAPGHRRSPAGTAVEVAVPLEERDGHPVADRHRPRVALDDVGREPQVGLLVEFPTIAIT